MVVTTLSVYPNTSVCVCSPSNRVVSWRGGQWRPHFFVSATKTKNEHLHLGITWFHCFCPCGIALNQSWRRRRSDLSTCVPKWPPAFTNSRCWEMCAFSESWLEISKACSYRLNFWSDFLDIYFCMKRQLKSKHLKHKGRRIKARLLWYEINSSHF